MKNQQFKLGVVVGMIIFVVAFFVGRTTTPIPERLYPIPPSCPERLCPIPKPCDNHSAELADLQEKYNRTYQNYIDLAERYTTQSYKNLELQQENDRLMNRYYVLEPFMDAAEQFAEARTYVRRESFAVGYNCYDYAHDFRKEFKHNISVDIAHGCDKNGNCHEWNRITFDFEPQIARFVDYSETYSD